MGIKRDTRTGSALNTPTAGELSAASAPPPRWQHNRAVVFVRSLLFEMGRISSMIFFAVTGQLLWPFPFHIRYRYMTLWGRFTLWWLRVTCGLRYVVHGLEQVDKQKNGLIFARHESAWETIALQSLFPPQVYVLKRELLRIPFFGWGMALLHPIALDRKAGRQALVKLVAQGLARLQEGLWVVIFPEGTRMPPGTLGDIKIGGPMLAAKADVPSYLVAHNAGQFWPKNGFMKYPGVIQVVISPPFYFYGQKPKAISEQIQHWFAQHLFLDQQGGRNRH